MLRIKPLSDIETKELIESSHAGLKRMKSRVGIVTALCLVLMLVYPIWIILVWYFLMIGSDILNNRAEKNIIRTQLENMPINYKVLSNFFITAWAESLCLVALVITLSVHEGQISHFIPYIILLCTSIYIATSTFHNAVLMFGHLALYNMAFMFISVRDVIITYPKTNPSLWAQFLCSILIIFFLTDSYRFIHKIHLDSSKKSQKINDARKYAEKLTQQKSDLISAIGHELRTPLNGILGFSQIIKRTKLSKQQLDYIERIEDAGKNLHFLLSNILDSETLGQDQLYLNIINTDIRALLDRTIRIFDPPAAEKGITLHLEIDNDIPTRLKVDGVRLGQCVSNLLSNAVRFTKTGSITVRASYENEPNQRLSISVIDTGIGIPEDQTDIIFEKFIRGENQSLLQSGTGLGLWLVRSIAKAMNGTITLVETSSNGSKFQLDFDLETQASKPPAIKTPLVNLHILHIEDTQTNLMLVRLLLKEQGVTVTEAQTGREAINLLKETEFDAVLCDLQLPDCNGNHLLENIRGLKNANAHVPVIALTAQPEKIDKVEHNAGFNAIISKPIDRKLFISTLTRIVKGEKEYEGTHNV
ncbi:MAG: ATP-binding protein [Amylibacter sp.]